jgi:hypothetical protein
LDGWSWQRAAISIDNDVAEARVRAVADRNVCFSRWSQQSAAISVDNNRAETWNRSAAGHEVRFSAW